MLSLAQTNMVIAALKAKLPECRFVLKTVTTLGDRKKTWSRSDTGIFVKELEEALSAGRIDMAVHSVKDLPSVIPAGLALGAVTRREDPRDLLISSKGCTLRSLPPHALVGTTSLRRKAYVLRVRPDLRVAGLRGNLDTRIRKLEDGEYDAIIVAAAGVKRFGARVKGSWLIPAEDMLPAVGQGALGIEVRAGDPAMRRVASLVDHRVTHLCVDAERSFLRETKAGCRMPVAGYACVRKGRMTLSASVISLDGRREVRVRRGDAAAQSLCLGAVVAREVLRKGGRKILKEVRDEEE
jgi:hydroxymethylbilane synthase